MARAPRLAALRRALRTRRAGWQLAAALALLGILLGAQRLGWHRLTRAANRAGHTLTHAARLMLGAGWLLLLLAAAGLALGLALSSPRGRAVVRWLQPRLTTRPVRWGAAAAILLVVLLALVVVVLPPRFTVHRHLEARDEVTIQNNVRTTLLQGLGALLVLTGAGIGATVTFRQIRVSQGQLQATREQMQHTYEQTEQTLETTRRQLKLTEQGQITDRYTKAVDQLGSQHLDVRLGGIYALERIARDSPQDRATIEEVLTAYVRGHAPWPPPPSIPTQPTGTQQPTTAAAPQPLATASPAAGMDTAGQLDEKTAEPQGPAADVQAAVTVLGRHQLSRGGRRPLDLTRVDLRGGLLDHANLQGAELDHANLQGARLDHINLKDARLEDANLQEAGLFLANLQGARLARANLQGARLARANLQGAHLNGANLQGAQANEDTRWPGWDREEAEARGVRYPSPSRSD